MGEAKVMLRYKYTDAYSWLRKKPSCKECIKYKSCPKYDSEKKSDLNTCNKGKFIYKNLEVTTDNADWYLFQIMRDVQLSKNTVEINFERNNGEKKSYTWDEKKIHSAVMKTYLHFLLEWGRDIKIERKQILSNIYNIKKQLSSDIKVKQKIKLEAKNMILSNKLQTVDLEIATFVRSIIDTRMRIEDHTLQIYTENSKLLSLIKQKVLEKNYIFKEVKKIELTETWWEPITSAS